MRAVGRRLATTSAVVQHLVLDTLPSRLVAQIKTAGAAEPRPHAVQAGRMADGLPTGTTSRKIRMNVRWSLQADEDVRLADGLVETGDRAGAIEAYLRACETIGESGHDKARSAVRRTGILVRVLELDPTRLDVRRLLAEAYVEVGLRDDAKRELRKVAQDAEASGTAVAAQEALARYAELSREDDSEAT